MSSSTIPAEAGRPCGRAALSAEGGVERARPLPTTGLPRGSSDPGARDTSGALSRGSRQYLCVHSGEPEGSFSPSGQKRRRAVVLAQLGGAQGWSRCPRRASHTHRYCMFPGARLGCGEDGRVTPALPRPWGTAGQAPGHSGTFTAELGAPPVQGSPRMGALAGVLGQGVAEAAGEVDPAAVAEVVPAGLPGSCWCSPVGTARERLAAQHLLADALGQSRPLAQSRVWNVPSSAPGLWEQDPHPVHSGPYRVIRAGPSISGTGSWHQHSVGPSIFCRLPNSGGVSLTSARKHKGPHILAQGALAMPASLPTLPVKWQL